MNEKELQIASKTPRALTSKNKAFLQHLASGRPTIEAYHLAGYHGDNHAAYQLRSELKVHLAALLEQGGFSREQLSLEINRLNELPLDPTIRNVNFRQKMDVLRLMDKALPKPMAQGDKPRITPFIVAINKPDQVTVYDSSKDVQARVDDSMARGDGPDGSVPTVEE